MTTPSSTADDLLDSIGDWDADRTASVLRDDVRLSLAGLADVTGKRSVRRLLVAVFASLAGLQLEPQAIWSREAVSVMELDVRCQRMDGLQLSFPLTVVVRSEDHLVSEIRVFTYEKGMVGNFLRQAA